VFVPGASVKPLIYGYMRVSEETPDDDIEQVEACMRRFAAVVGFCYATTFFEYQYGLQAAFDELAGELDRCGARHVVVPSLSHLSAHPMLCCLMIDRLELGAGAQVHALDELPVSVPRCRVGGLPGVRR